MAPIKSALKGAVREALQSGGGYLGAATGIPRAEVFGRQLGQKLSKLLGSGDYMSNTSVNDLIHPKGLLPSASFADGDTDMIRIRRREFLGDIKTGSVAGAFDNNSFPINAGIFSTFPFLSRVAANYEEYCFDGLVFEFISSASPYIGNSALGTVVASMEYNSSMPEFTQKFTMENSAHAISARLDHNLMYGVECAKGSNVQNCYYVRSGTSTLPITTTDLGTFQIATVPSVSVPTSTVVGELWVTYDVVLKRPYLTSLTGAYHRYSTLCSAAAPFGTNTVSQTNIGPVNFSYTSGTTLSFDNANIGDSFVLLWQFRGTVATAANLVYPVVTYTGAAGVAGWEGDTAFLFTSPAAASTTLVAVMTITFTATASSGSVVFGAAGTLPTGTTQSDQLITYLGNIGVGGW